MVLHKEENLFDILTLERPIYTKMNKAVEKITGAACSTNIEIKEELISWK